MNVATLIDKVLFIGILLAGMGIGGVILRTEWNDVMPSVFGLKPITVKQAFLLLSIVVTLTVVGVLTVWTLSLLGGRRMP